MKRRTKLTIAGISILAGALLLGGCTASFCSVNDKAHMLYAFDYGVSDYYRAEDRPTDQNGNPMGEPIFEGNTNVYYVVDRPTNTGSGIGKADKDAASANIQAPSNAYFVKMDQIVLENALRSRDSNVDLTAVTLEDVVNALDQYGYLKYSGTKLWDEWNNINTFLRQKIDNPAYGLTIDDLPTNDYLKIYKKDMNSLISGYRSCIAISEDDYGYYGYANGAQWRTHDIIGADKHGKTKVTIEAKNWGYAWKKGFFEGLLVFPIAWLTETFVANFKNAGMPSGLPQLLAIFAITFIVRSLMLVVTLKQTTSNAKMQALQPEITKIQNKYPNANTNNYEKQQMAAEMNKLYKKNKINPLGALLVMVVQFPVFICVWGALQGCASLSSDAFLNLHLSDSINTVLFNAANWNANGGFSAFTALVLFLLMAASQVVSMLLPQFIQKMKRKKVASLGKNPAQTDQQSKMKMFTYIMMAMIIFMGFTLPSAMGVYWFVGALFSIAQTLIIELINNRKSKKKGK